MEFASRSTSNLKVALCQLAVGSNKPVNIEGASNAIRSAEGMDILVLPECWNSPYSTASFPEYAEVVPSIGNSPDPTSSPSVHMLCEMAREKNVWIVGGSIPERDTDSKIYNTCVVLNPAGDIVGKHRKVHLFDIDVPGKITFKESDSLSPGESYTLVDTPWGKIGVGICYDIRFPEYAMMLRQMGANILIYPGAFNLVTGPAHWELLQRARAVDNQLFVITCSPARDTSDGAGYKAWGHSTVVSPWGDIIATTEHDPTTVYATLELDKINHMRDSIPCWKQKRNDLYQLKFST